MTPRPSTRIARDLAVEQSLDAAIEIDEMIRGDRADAPAFEVLLASLIGSTGLEFNAAKKELLADSRLTSLCYRAAKLSSKLNVAESFDRMFELLIAIRSANFSQISKDDLSRVRDFCIGLNQELVSEAFARIPDPPLSRSRQNKLFAANEC
jgi:hypothetical protein